MFYNPANGLQNASAAPAQLPQNVLAPVPKHLSHVRPIPGAQQTPVASATMPAALSRPPAGHLAEAMRRFGFLI